MSHNEQIINEQIINELKKIYQLTYNLYMIKLNDNEINTSNSINFIQSLIYNVNYLKNQLNESMNKLNKIKQDNCNHKYKYDNINYEPMQLICINCNKIF